MVPERVRFVGGITSVCASPLPDKWAWRLDGVITLDTALVASHFSTMTVDTARDLVLGKADDRPARRFSEAARLALRRSRAALLKKS